MNDQLTQSELDRVKSEVPGYLQAGVDRRDGLPVLGQVDGLDGYCEYLKTLCSNLETMQSAEQKKAKKLQRKKLTWVNSQGWQRDDGIDINFL